MHACAIFVFDVTALVSGAKGSDEASLETNQSKTRTNKSVG